MCTGVCMSGCVFYDAAGEEMWADLRAQGGGGRSVRGGWGDRLGEG